MCQRSALTMQGCTSPGSPATGSNCLACLAPSPRLAVRAAPRRQAGRRARGGGRNLGRALARRRLEVQRVARLEELQQLLRQARAVARDALLELALRGLLGQLPQARHPARARATRDVSRRRPPRAAAGSLSPACPGSLAVSVSSCAHSSARPAPTARVSRWRDNLM